MIEIIIAAFIGLLVGILVGRAKQTPFNNKKELIVGQNILLQTLEYPASMPNDLSGSDKILWYVEYNKLTINERVLLEERQQSVSLKSIAKNIAFFAWIAIIMIARYIFLLYFYN